MLRAIFKAVFGSGLSDQLRRAYEAKLKATNDSEKLAAEIQINSLDARLKSQINSGRIVALIQLAWVAPFIIYNAKLVVWDKVLGWGVTDPLSPELYNLQMIMVGFFFLTTTIKGITK